MNDTGLSLLAGALVVISALAGGFILAAGVLPSLPGADTLMLIAMVCVVFGTLGLVGFLAALGR